MTPEAITQEYLDRCEIVDRAYAEDLLDREQAQAMKDRYRDEAEQKMADLVREMVRP